MAFKIFRFNVSVEAMAVRWIAAGPAWCVGIGLTGMVAVSAWALADHLWSERAAAHRVSLAPEHRDTLAVSTLLPRSALSIPVMAAAPQNEAADPPPVSLASRSGAEHANTDGDTPDSGVSELRLTVRKGDSLYTLFEERGLPQQDLQNIVFSDRSVADRLAALRPGDQFRLEVNASGNVLALALVREGEEILNVERRSGEDGVAKGTPAPIAASEVEAPAPPKTSVAQAVLERGVNELGWTPREIRVADGDSLYGIFVEQGLAVSELIDLLRSGEDAQALKRLHPDQKLEVYLDGEESVRHLVHHLNSLDSLHFFRQPDGFSSEAHRAELDRRFTSVNGSIRDSFYLSAQRNGLSDRLIMEMTEIFGWDIDFALEIREGDRFAVIYEELYHPDGSASDGAIVAAEFVNRARTIRALRYEDENGVAQYYSPEGHSMRKAFLRAPVSFTRISSRYGMRQHPILDKLRHHNGVDYAAPRNTPVMATSDGIVAFAGRKGGYGKTIILEHGEVYSTLYAHLNGYAKGLKRGVAVEQGQTIGYVGSTGLSTGPHLHYEFRVEDRHTDPLTVKLPAAPAIASKYKSDFLERTRDFVARLEHMSQTHLASTQ